MSDGLLDIDFSYKNIDFDPSVFYEGCETLISEKRHCLFCSDKAVKIICNDQKNGLFPFVAIRHCNSSTCFHLAVDMCRESLMNIINPTEFDDFDSFPEKDSSLDLA